MLLEETQVAVAWEGGNRDKRPERSWDTTGLNPRALLSTQHRASFTGGRLYNCTGPHSQGLRWVPCSAVTILKFLIVFE